MPPVYARGAIAADQNHVCLRCRLRSGRFSTSPGSRSWSTQFSTAVKDPTFDLLKPTAGGDGIFRKLYSRGNDSSVSRYREVVSRTFIPSPTSNSAYRRIAVMHLASHRLGLANAKIRQPAISSSTVSKAAKQRSGIRRLHLTLSNMGEQPQTQEPEAQAGNEAGAKTKKTTKISSQNKKDASKEKSASKEKKKSEKRKTSTDKAEKGNATKEEQTALRREKTIKQSNKIENKIDRLRRRLDELAPIVEKMKSRATKVSTPRITKHVVSDQVESVVRRRSPKKKQSDLNSPFKDIVPAATSNIEALSAGHSQITPLDIAGSPVPTLAHGLERVLFNPGVYHLQDPRSRVFNFDPYLQKIMPIAEFDFTALNQYITSSKDELLQKIGNEHKKRYVGSTSSMTGMLAQFHFLLSQWRPIDVKMLSKAFPDRGLLSFTQLQRLPAAVFLRWKDGSYAIDADKEFDTANVLSMLGKSMEKLLTLNTNEFERYRKSSTDPVKDEEAQAPEAYHYSTFGDFLMRSQLDAHDDRLPGTGMFDLKTRAVVSVRMDVDKYEQGTGYEIKNLQGEFESFEREYFDMIRAAFLKYSMQVRMGRMDGIFVAFHNVERIFGFQYISLPEMDRSVHGQKNTLVGDQEFVLSLELLNKILDKATKKFPETSIRLHFETRDTQTPFMYIFAEPVTEERVGEIQSQNAAGIEEFERRVLGLDKKEEGEDRGPEWTEIQANVQDSMDEDELSLDESDGGNGDVLDPSQAGALDANDNPIDDDPDVAKSGLVDDGDEDDDDDEDEEDGDEDDEEDSEDTENEEDEEEDDEESEDNEEESEEQDESEEIDDGSSFTSDEQEVGKIEPTETDNQQNSPLEEGNTDGVLTMAGGATSIPENTAQATAQDGLEANPSSANISPDSQDPASSESVTAKAADEESIEADSKFLELLSKDEENSQNKSAPTEILAMTLSIRNKVNDKFVLRPNNLDPLDKWSIEYSLVEVTPQSRAQALYEACKFRRKKRLDSEMFSPEDGEGNLTPYVKLLRQLSVEGREWRQRMDSQEKDETVKSLSRNSVDPDAK